MLSKNLFNIKNPLNALHKTAFNVLLKNSKCVTIQVRTQSVWTEDRVVKSPFKDIEIPNCTLFDYVWQNLEKWPERTLSVCATTGRSYTFSEVFKLSTTFAASLRKKLKIQDGDAVMVILPNIPEFPIVAMGILGAGGLITTVNPIYTAHEVQRQILMSNAKIIITLPEILPVIKDALKIAKVDLKTIVVRTNENDILPERTIDFKELIEDEHIDKTCLKEVKRSIDDVSFLPYSSGTTGLPKGVQLTHKNIIANLEQMNEPKITCHNETTASNQDTMMAVLPFFHIYGASAVMFHKMSLGIKLVTLAKFQSQTFLDALERTKANILFAAPPLILLLIQQGTPKNLQYLQMLLNGAAPLAASDALKIFERAGRKFDLRQAYGLTETSPSATVCPKGLENYGCVGVPIPSTELRIVDKDLNNLGPNETGELLIRGPQVMKGYKDNPKTDAEVFPGDGWFRSGDLAVIDEDGVVSIADRLKELIKVKGFQVPPAELEAVLRDHPAIKDAGVVGIPHPKNGESPKAFIVLKEGQKADAKEISEFVKQRVAAYKRIEEIVFLDDIPKSASGKILRRILKDTYC